MTIYQGRPEILRECCRALWLLASENSFRGVRIRFRDLPNYSTFQPFLAVSPARPEASRLSLPIDNHHDGLSGLRERAVFLFDLWRPLQVVLVRPVLVKLCGG